MGLTSAEMLGVIASLSRRNFYKSMTTYADNRVWQDVYHAATPIKKDAYIKITLRDEAPVIQFKEKVKMARKCINCESRKAMTFRE